MINVLIVSEDEGRQAEVAKLVKEGMPGGKVAFVREDAWRQSENIEHLQQADVVIAIRDRLRQEDLVDLEALLELPRHAMGVLLSAVPLSSEDIVAAMQAGVRYAKSWPLDGDDLLRQLHAIEKKKRTRSGREGRVLTFLSSQGGSGTTFIATQIAHACATKLGKKVLMIDADRQYADAQLFLTADLLPTTLVELAAKIERLDAALFDAGVTRLHDNLDLLPGAGDPVKAAQIQADELKTILQFACPRYDVVIVDAGHHIDAAIMTVLDHSTEIFSVMRQSLPDLYSAKRLTSILQELGYATDKMGTIINQFDGATKLNMDVLQDSLQRKTTHRFPRDMNAVQRASDKGVPLLEVAPQCKLARAIEEFVLHHFEVARPSGAARWLDAFRRAASSQARAGSRQVRFH